MKYMRYLMALAILSAMMGWAYATTVDMPGGTISKNENGATVEGYAKFSYDANSLSADMYAKANAIGEGNAYINMNRPTEASKVDSGKEVTAKGTIEAKVDGKSSDAKVTSVGWIHSDTRKDSNKISGNAFNLLRDRQNVFIGQWSDWHPGGQVRGERKCRWQGHVQHR